MTGDELVERLAKKAYENVPSISLEVWRRSIRYWARDFVDALGITRQQAELMYALAERAAKEDGDLAPHYVTWEIGAALTTLLDAAEANDD